MEYYVSQKVLGPSKMPVWVAVLGPRGYWITPTTASFHTLVLKNFGEGDFPFSVEY